MKAAIVIGLATLLIASPVAADEAPTRCPAFYTSMPDHRGAAPYSQFITGYIAAVNRYSDDRNALRGRTPKEARFWLRSWCRGHREAFLEDAVEAMLDSIAWGAMR